MFATSVAVVIVFTMTVFIGVTTQSQIACSNVKGKMVPDYVDGNFQRVTNLLNLALWGPNEGAFTLDTKDKSLYLILNRTTASFTGQKLYQEIKWDENDENSIKLRVIQQKMINPFTNPTQVVTCYEYDMGWKIRDFQCISQTYFKMSVINDNSKGVKNPNFRFNGYFNLVDTYPNQRKSKYRPVKDYFNKLWKDCP